MTRKEFIKKMGQMACVVPLLPYMDVFGQLPKEYENKNNIPPFKSDLNVFEFIGTDKEIRCAETIVKRNEIVPFHFKEIFRRDNFLIRKTAYGSSLYGTSLAYL